MGDIYRRASPGDSIKGIPAELYNALIDLLKDYRRRFPSTAPSNGAVKVKLDVDLQIQNLSGAALPEFAVVGIGSPIISPGSDDAYFFGDLIFGSAEPSGGLFAVMQRPTGPDEIAPARMTGITLAMVDLVDVSHSFAGPTDGEYNFLTSDQSGPVEILWLQDDAETGQQWAIVRFGQGVPVPPDIPVPTITDPTDNVAAGPYFDFTSADGTVGIKAAGKTVDFSAALGPMLQFCIPDCNGNPQCFRIPSAFYVGPGPCLGSGTPVFALWYCLQPPAPGSGGAIVPCGPCAVAASQYCVAYPAFTPDFADSLDCDVFASAGWQTVTQIGPCAWTWQESDLPCAITFGFAGNTAFVQFGNAPNEQQLGRYEIDASTWDCLSQPITLILTDPALWPNSPPSVTVYPNACPPPTPPCGPCLNPPTFVCVTIPGLTGTCGLCTALAAGVTLTYSTDLISVDGSSTCGYVASIPGGKPCKHQDNRIVLVPYTGVGGTWALFIGNYLPGAPVHLITFFASTWDCASPLTLQFNSTGSDTTVDCGNWEEVTATVTVGPCSLGSGSGAQPLWYCLQVPAPGSGSAGGGGGGGGACPGNSCSSSGWTVIFGTINGKGPPTVFATSGNDAGVGAASAVWNAASIFFTGSIYPAAAIKNVGTTNNSISHAFRYSFADGGCAFIGVRFDSAAANGFIATIENNTLYLIELLGNGLFTASSAGLTLTDGNCYVMHLSDDGTTLTASMIDDTNTLRSASYVDATDFVANTYVAWGWFNNQSSFSFTTASACISMP